MRNNEERDAEKIERERDWRKLYRRIEMEREKEMVQQDEGRHALERGVYGNTNEAWQSRVQGFRGKKGGKREKEGEKKERKRQKEGKEEIQDNYM